MQLLEMQQSKHRADPRGWEERIEDKGEGLTCRCSQCCWPTTEEPLTKWEGWSGWLPWASVGLSRARSRMKACYDVSTGSNVWEHLGSKTRSHHDSSCLKREKKNYCRFKRVLCVHVYVCVSWANPAVCVCVCAVDYTQWTLVKD